MHFFSFTPTPDSLISFNFISVAHSKRLHPFALCFCMQDTKDTVSHCLLQTAQQSSTADSVSFSESTMSHKMLKFMKANCESLNFIDS